jgi:hypothetical protein
LFDIFIDLLFIFIQAWGIYTYPSGFRNWVAAAYFGVMVCNGAEIITSFVNKVMIYFVKIKY